MTISHSIIIPHRNRHARLWHCLHSITRSACRTGIDDYEVCVIDLNSQWPPWNCIFPTQIGAYRLFTADGGFNKCYALNHGLDVARGSTITFLDADAIVGPRWLEGIRRLAEDASLTRLCYRVRMLDEDQLRQFCDAAHNGEWDQHYTMAFRKFDRLGYGYEAYYQVNNNWWADPKRPEPPSHCGAHVFGNSQFSMRREDIGDLFFDADTYLAAGHEDLDFIEQVRQKFGADYKGLILTDPEHAMVHIRSPQGAPGEKDWSNPQQAEKQRLRYMDKWYGTGSVAGRAG